MSPIAHILVIEDEHVIARALQRLLERHGYAAETAGTLQEARSRIQMGRFDLIIADLRLPDGLGTDIVPVRGSAPVIVMSSYLHRGREEGNVGIACYIAKPFDHDEILGKNSGCA